MQNNGDKKRPTSLLDLLLEQFSINLDYKLGWDDSFCQRWRVGGSGKQEVISEGRNVKHEKKCKHFTTFL